MKKIMFVLLGLFVLALSVPAFAHFQLLYSPDSVPKSKSQNQKSLT
jgi:uncharacterized GH25 family protein